MWEILSGGNVAVQKQNSVLEFDLEKLPQKTLRDLEKFVKSRLTPIAKQGKGQSVVKKPAAALQKDDLAPPKTFPAQAQQVALSQQQAVAQQSSQTRPDSHLPIFHESSHRPSFINNERDPSAKASPKSSKSSSFFSGGLD